MANDDDLDENNPIDLSSEEWAEIYGQMEDFEGYLDNDHSMDF